MTPTSVPHFLAIDIGSTGIKVLLVDENGRPVQRSRRDVPLIHERVEWAAADAAGWWRAVCELIREVLVTSDVPTAQVRGVGVTGLMHALVPTAADGSALDTVMLWFDQRSRAQVREIAERWGSRLTDWVGGLPGPNAALPKLLWLRQERPEVLDRCSHLLLAKDYVRYRLTGVAATDRSDARSTGLLDPTSGTWSAPLLDAVLGLTVDRMPPIRPATEIIGAVTSEAAAACGLREGTPVVAGAGDVTATLVGIDGYRPGLACAYLGTGIWMAETRSSEDGRAGEMPSTRHLGSTTACGASVLWWCRLFGVEPETHALVGALAEAEQIPLGADGLLFLPHLMGERAIRANPEARGVWFGMTLAHRRAHLLRAIVEGNACLIRRCLEHVGLSADRPLLLAGGAAGSPLFRRAIAGVTGRRVLLPEQHEATALGAAMLAAVGTGHFASAADAAAAWVRDGISESPHPHEVERYQAVYQRYVALEAAAEPLYGREELRDGERNTG